MHVPAATLELLMSGALDLTDGSLRVLLIDDSWSPSGSTATLADVPAAARVGTAATLTGVTVTGGVLDAADTTITAPAGETVAGVVVYSAGGTEATSPIVAVIDERPDRLPISVTTDGDPVTVRWSATGILVI